MIQQTSFNYAPSDSIDEKWMKFHDKYSYGQRISFEEGKKLCDEVKEKSDQILHFQTVIVRVAKDNLPRYYLGMTVKKYVKNNEPLSWAVQFKRRHFEKGGTHIVQANHIYPLLGPNPKKTPKSLAEINQKFQRMKQLDLEEAIAASASAKQLDPERISQSSPVPLQKKQVTWDSPISRCADRLPKPALEIDFEEIALMLQKISDEDLIEDYRIFYTHLNPEGGSPTPPHNPAELEAIKMIEQAIHTYECEIKRRQENLL